MLWGRDYTTIFEDDMELFVADTLSTTLDILLPLFSPISSILFEIRQFCVSTMFGYEVTNTK